MWAGPQPEMFVILIYNMNGPYSPESGANLKDIWLSGSWIAEQLSKYFLVRHICGLTSVSSESTVLNPNCCIYIAGELFQLDCW